MSTETRSIFERIGGVAATPEQVKRNVERWRTEQAKRKEMEIIAKAEGVSIAELKWKLREVAKKRTLSLKAHRVVKGSLGSTLGDILKSKGVKLVEVGK